MPIKIKRRSARPTPRPKTSPKPAAEPYFDMNDVLALNVNTAPDLTTGAIHFGWTISERELRAEGFDMAHLGGEPQRWVEVPVVLAESDLILVNERFGSSERARREAREYIAESFRLLARWARDNVGVDLPADAFGAVVFDVDTPSDATHDAGRTGVYRDTLPVAAEAIRDAIARHRAAHPIDATLLREVMDAARAYHVAQPDIPFDLPDWARAAAA